MRLVRNSVGVNFGYYFVFLLVAFSFLLAISTNHQFVRASLRIDSDFLVSFCNHFLQFHLVLLFKTEPLSIYIYK